MYVFSHVLASNYLTFGGKELRPIITPEVFRRPMAQDVSFEDINNNYRLEALSYD